MSVSDSANDHDSAALRVLIAEPHQTVAQCLSEIVARIGSAEVAAQVHRADDVVEAAAKIAPDVAIIDLSLSSSAALLEDLKMASPATRVIVLGDRVSVTGETLTNALVAGAVGALYKESSLEELARALGSSADAPVLADEAVGVIVRSYLDSLTQKRHRDIAMIEALAMALETRDIATGEHLHRVTDLASQCMREIDPGLARNEELMFGFMLHDVGKIGVPDAILNKPGPLSLREWKVMQRHPELGVRIVKPIGFTEAATDVILYHHERWNGAGYPEGLAGEDIPLTARAFAVADAFDAMTSARPYRSAMREARALEIIESRAGIDFDPDVARVFVDLRD